MTATYRRIFSLLSPGDRRSFVALIALMLAAGVADVVGVAAIVPLFAVIADPDVVETNAALAALHAWGGFEGTRGFLGALCLAAFVLLLVSVAVRVGTNYATARFTREVVLTLSQELLAKYLRNPYEWYLSRHSADLAKTLLSETKEVVNGSITPAMKLISDGIACAAMVLFLVRLEPVGALLTAAGVGGAFGLIYWRLRGLLERIGADRREANRERFQIAQEALGGIKDVKVMELEETYIRRFHGPSRRLARHMAALQLVGELPRYALEALGFGGMLLFLFFLLVTTGGDPSAVLPVFGAFALAGLRLLPTVQSLFRSVTQMRFHQGALEALFAELNEPTGPAHGPAPDPAQDRAAGPTSGPTSASETAPPPRPAPVEGLAAVPPAPVPAAAAGALPLRRELALEGVGYRYPGAPAPSLSGVDLRIPARSSCGFVGPTGAGKTTLIDVVLGLLAPQVGRLSVDGVAVDSRNLRAWQRSIGYVQQSVHLVDDTVAANVAFGVPPGEINMAAVRRAAAQASLDGYVSGLPAGYATPVGERGVRLSGGQRQRIGIARALYRDPDVVVFDEATSALDTVTERAVMEAIGALGGEKTVLVVTHRLSTVAACDQIVVMRDGRIEARGRHADLAAAGGTFAELLRGTRGAA
jgi:ABC-type multidrug transport system fused ATPase/permease subunit